MPSGVFKPYAGVSTAALFFTRGAQTKDIWFYDMAHDGFSLDDKRVKVEENDIPDVLECWTNRFDKKFIETRDLRIGELRAQLTPMKEKRLKLQADINRLSFELALDPGPDGSNVPKVGADKSSRVNEPSGRLQAAQEQLSTLQSLISAPQSEMDRLTRQFWVTKEQVKANKYDLSASRYRQSGPGRCLSREAVCDAGAPVPFGKRNV